MRDNIRDENRTCAVCTRIAWTRSAEGADRRAGAARWRVWRTLTTPASRRWRRRYPEPAASAHIGALGRSLWPCNPSTTIAWTRTRDRRRSVPGITPTWPARRASGAAAWTSTVPRPTDQVGYPRIENTVSAIGRRIIDKRLLSRKIPWFNYFYWINLLIKK